MRRYFLTITIAMVGAIGLSMPLAHNDIQAKADQRCFPETNICISGRIRQFWEEHGGLPILGFPITPQYEETIENGAFQVQWFERNRLELHPENQPPYDVLLGRLGATRLMQQDRDWQNFPKSSPRADCRFFAQTGHNVCGEILAAWRNNGQRSDKRTSAQDDQSLGLFGLPLSDAQIEMLSDGKLYTVQWFERARFEVHLDQAAPYSIMLGLLGNEVYTYSKPAPTPTPLPASTPTQTAEPTRKPRSQPSPRPTSPPAVSPQPTLPAYP